MTGHRRLLLITHRGLNESGGAVARWKAFARYLPEHGWQVEVIAAPARTSAIEFTSDPSARRRVAARARAMGLVGKVARPVAHGLGVQPEAFPPSMAWARRGARELRSRLGQADAVVATGPPVAALVAARLGMADGGPPLVAELRDLWAGSPAFDVRGGLLTRIERWMFSPAAAVVVMSPEAQADVAARHAHLADRIRVIPNGFDPALLHHAAAGGASPEAARRTLIHSGIVTGGRPPFPLLDVLTREPYRSRFRLVLHGYVTPDVATRLEYVDPDLLDVVPPSSWDDAVARIAAAHAGVVLQGSAVGDATAVASKVFEYLALGKPVLTVTDGGATEAALRRLGAGELAARLDDPGSIAAALDRLLNALPAPPSAERLARYDRRRLAGEMAALLDELLRHARA